MCVCVCVCVCEREREREMSPCQNVLRLEMPCTNNDTDRNVSQVFTNS